MNNMTNQEESENLHKADQVYFLYDPQPVRLLDVIYVGPVMIYGGIKGKFHPFVKWSLIGVGICTILYNGANFIINEKKAMEKRQAEKEAIRRAMLEEQAIAEDKLMNVIDTERVYKPIVNVANDRPVQVPIATEDTDGVQLPPEVAELLNQTFVATDGNPAIEKKGKRKPKAIEAEVIYENNLLENGKTNENT
jgi:hypothetical protein